MIWLILLILVLVLFCGLFFYSCMGIVAIGSFIVFRLLPFLILIAIIYFLWHMFRRR